MSIQKNKIEYLSVKEIAHILAISPQGMHKRLNNPKYNYKYRINNGNGGKRYEILISSLEPELREKVFKYFDDGDCNAGGEPKTSQSARLSLDLDLHRSSDSHGGKDSADNTFHNNAPFSLEFTSKPLLGETKAAELPALVLFPLKSAAKPVIPDNAKKIALAKFDVVRLWEEFRADKKDKKKADESFIAAFNSGVVSAYLLDITGKTTIKSLYRWSKLLKDNDNSYLALINGYNYTGESELKTSLTDFEKETFIKLYFNDGKMNLGSAYYLLKCAFEQKGLEVKSIATYRRFLSYIKRNHNDFNVLSREGEKAFKDNVMSYVRRDIDNLNPGDALVADGNKLDFQVINPYTGKPTRASLIVFLDWASFDVAGFEIMPTENTQGISSALRNAILNMGKIPKHVYIDNGRAFKGKYFTGCNDFKEANLRGVYEALGIKLTVAKAYNGRAKVVERFFNEFVKSCPPLVSSYVGNCIQNKPAHLLRNEKFHKKLHENDEIPTIEKAKEIINAWLEFYRQKCKKRSGLTIKEYVEKYKGEGVNPDLLDELLMVSAIRTVNRSTIRLFNREYESPALFGKTGKFLVKYSMNDISQIKVYSIKGEYVGIAKAIQTVKAFCETQEDLYSLREELKKQKAQMNFTKKKTRALIGKRGFKGIDFLPVFGEACGVIENAVVLPVQPSTGLPVSAPAPHKKAVGAENLLITRSDDDMKITIFEKLPERGEF